MSKKMMKRSLALGALMAFVITGSAWAAVPTDVTEATLDTSNNRYYGIRLQTGTESATIGAASYIVDVQSDDTNSGVFAFQLDSNGTKLTFTDNATFSATTNTSGTGNNQLTALSVYDGQVIVKGNVAATANATDANGKSAYGISVYGGGTAAPIASFEGDSVTVTVTTETARNGAGTDYSEAAGVNVIEGTLITSENTDTTIDVTGTNTTQNAAPVYGVLTEAGSATFGGTTEITVTSAAASAYGVKVIDGYYTSSQSGDDSANASFNNVNITVENTNEDGYAAGMYACERKVGNETSQIDVSGDAEITVIAGGEAYGVLSGKSGAGNATINLGTEKDESVIKVNVTAKDATGIMARGQNGSSAEGSVLNVNGKLLDIAVTGQGEGAYGIYVANGTDGAEDKSETSNVNECQPDLTQVNINTETTKIVVKGTTDEIGTMGMMNVSQGSLNINSNLEVTADNVLVTRGKAVTNINVDEDGNAILGKSTVLNGNIAFDYDADTSGSAVDTTVNISLDGTGSSWTGNTVVYKDDELVTERAFDDNGNIVCGDYPSLFTVSNFSLNVSNGAKWTTDSDSFVNNLNLDDGVVEMEGEGQQKVLVGTVNGDGTVTTTNVNNNMNIANDNANELTVRAAGELAKEIASLSGEEQAEKLEDLTSVVTTIDEKIVADKVGTTQGAVAGAITADVVVDDAGDVSVKNVSEGVHTGNQAIGEAAVALKAHWRAHMNDMNKRMGELRNANGEHGVWTRMVRGESEFEGAKMQYNQYQLGYDEKLSVDKRWTVGAAVTFSEGNSNYSTGSTEDDSTAFAIYGSKLNNDGTFVDLIARYANVETDLDDVNAGKGDYSAHGYSVSAEFGKRIQQGNGMWIEPQVELTYGSLDSADFTFSKNNNKVHVGDIDSLIGRVGFSLGKDIKEGNVYARASYLYDFDGETETTYTNGITRSIKEDLGGGWWEVGVGANFNLSKATYIYADIEKTFGGEVDTNWQWNLGVRYSF